MDNQNAALNNDGIPETIEETLERVLRNRDELVQQLESLQHDKAALIEVLEWYGDKENSKCDLKYFGTLPNVMIDKGERARTIISRMKGDTHE